MLLLCNIILRYSLCESISENEGCCIKKAHLIVAVFLMLMGSFAYVVPKALAATGGGTATIAVDGGAQGAGVTVVQATSHIFTTVLTIDTSGMTLGAASPTFTIPSGFTTPNAHAVANAGLVDTDGKWSAVANGGGCTVDSSPVSSTTVASGQVITVDITADCAVGDTITVTYQGTSAVTMAATALTVSTANAGDPGPVTAITSGSPTITVTAAPSPSPTPTPTPSPSPSPAPSPTPSPSPSPTSGSDSTSTSASSADPSSTAGGSPCIAPAITTVPRILNTKRLSPTSIFISWGPYAGIDTFNVQYGLSDGNYLYNADVTGFSTTINSLPLNTPIWITVAARNHCTIGTYSSSRLVGNPGLPDTGFAP